MLYSKFYQSLIITFIVIIGSSNLSSFAANKADKHTVRVTTGIQQVQGWEQGLIKGNPNLARWHWDPIYSYKQGYATISPDTSRTTSVPGKQVTGKPGKPAYNYIIPARSDDRPTHIPFSDKALKEVQGRYSMSNGNNLPKAQAISDENVSGQLYNKQTAVNVMPRPTQTEVSTYGQLYSRNEKLDTGLKYSSQKTSVYGQLLGSQQKKKIKK